MKFESGAVTRARALLLAALVAVSGGVLWFAADPWRVEQVYVEGAGPWLAGIPNLLTRHLPFSLAELVVAATVLGIVVWLRHAIRRVRRRTGALGPILVRTANDVLTALLGVFVLFYAVWGLSYARPNVEERQRWAPSDTPALDVSPDELAELSEVLVHRVNDLYLEIHHLPDGFAPTASPRTRWELDAAIDRGYFGVVDDLGLHADVARSRGPTKPLLSSELFSWLRIGGMYFPFTAEANINEQAPDWQRPFTMAHEKAHQRFLASENEANFHGMLACMYSDDLHVRYSGWLFAQRQVLRALSHADPWRFFELVQLRLPGVQRDVDTARAFWTGYAGPLSDLSRAVNDAYLKANQVEGGVQSYGRSLELIVLYRRNRDWPADPPRK